MKPTKNSRTRFRTTTALCVVSTVAFVTAAYASDWGRSNWDKRLHFNRFMNNNDHNNNGNNNNNHNGNGNKATTERQQR